MSTMEGIRDSMSETLWRRVVVEQAERFGWEWMHIRPARSSRPGIWKTPVDGSLGVGWPDLVLIRTGRTLAVECKAVGGRLSEAQQSVLASLREAGWQTYVWDPRDWETVLEVLR